MVVLPTPPVPMVALPVCAKRWWLAMVVSGDADPTGNNGGATVYNTSSWCEGEESGGVADATGPNAMRPSSWCEGE